MLSGLHLVLQHMKERDHLSHLFQATTQSFSARKYPEKPSYHTALHAVINVLSEATKNILVAQDLSRLSASQLFGGLYSLFDN